MDHYDVITIGAGGAAYPAAFTLKRSGHTVLMIDKKGVMSGNCLSEGCVPSKAIIENVHNYVKMRRFGNYSLDYAKLVELKDHVQNVRYEQHTEELSKAGLSIKKGTARLVDDHTVSVDDGTGMARYSADHIIIASGSDTFIPKFPGAEFAVTSSSFFSISPKIRHLPNSIVIIGGGYIGMETASFLSILGTRVYVIEMLPKPLATLDPEPVNALLTLLPGYESYMNSTVKSIERIVDGYRVNFDHGGSMDHIDSEFVMLAVGRIPIFPEGTEELGVRYQKHGIIVNNGMQTSVKNIYATGDVNGITPLFHAAKRQSLVAANNIMAGDRLVDYFDPLSVPFTVFTIPQLSFVGILPEQAKKENIKFTTAEFSLDHDAMAQINGEMVGKIRLLVDARMKIIGGYAIGNDAGNIINEIALAISKGLSIRDFAEMAHQHPMTFEELDSIGRQFY
ncbi:MAG: dihydrolipoyl dehydrogenase [Thermoplasmatales archaeon]|nr:dihydrolipoyl dehydrogenase [Thermoplasmatales archaeon]MCW6170947.1 dihydrolipoyl dehydrogenase [Thermoplasmatales archaeon]